MFASSVTARYLHSVNHIDCVYYKNLSDQQGTFGDLNILPLVMTNSNSHIVKVTLDYSAPSGALWEGKIQREFWLP